MMPRASGQAATGPRNGVSARLTSRTSPRSRRGTFPSAMPLSLMVTNLVILSSGSFGEPRSLSTQPVRLSSRDHRSQLHLPWNTKKQWAGFTALKSMPPRLKNSLAKRYYSSCMHGGDVPCAVETERRLGSRLRNHFRRLAEPELRVARSERRHQLRHVLAAVHAPKALGGFQHPGRDPA